MGDKYTQIFPESLKGVDHLGHLCVEHDIIKVDLTGIGCEGVEWIQLASDNGRWRDIVNTVVNFRLSQRAGNLFTS
jgi:hypothetical protein